MDSPRLRLVLLTICATTVTAAADAPRPQLTFGDAVGGAAALPELIGAAAATRELRQLRIPRPWAPLIVTLAPSARLAPGDQRGLEGGVAVQQALPLGDLAGQRRAHADAVAARSAADLAARTLDARLAAAAAWIDSWAAQAHRATAARDLELARAVVAVTQRGRAAGAFTAPEVADARAFLAEAEVRDLDAEGLVTDAAFALATATGRSGQLLADGALPEPVLPADAAWPAIVARARQLPAVVAEELGARADRARALDERASRGHQLVLGAELLRDGPGALAAIATVGVSVPHDRGEREAAVALADALQADARAAGLAARGAQDLARTWHDVEHTGEILEALERQLVPAADEAAARRQHAFELGETTLVELLAAQRTALAAHARVDAARAAHAWARVRAWLLVETIGGAA